MVQPDHWSESGGRMPFHVLGSFVVSELSERRLPPLRSVLSFGKQRTSSPSSTMKAHALRLTILIIAISVLSGCCAPRSTKQSWEYNVTSIPFGPPPGSVPQLQAHLDARATEGWVLEQLIERQGGWMVVMKRLKKE